MIGAPLLGLDALLTQQAKIERDAAVADQFGARPGRDWQPLVTVRCFMWWGTGRTITRMGQVRTRAEETLDTNIGGMVLAPGTDITARDRILEVLAQDGSVLEHGPFELLAVSAFEGVTELTFRRFT